MCFLIFDGFKKPLPCQLNVLSFTQPIFSLSQNKVFLLAILSWAIYKKIVNIGNQFVHALIVHFQLIVYAVLHFCMKQATVFKPFSIFCFFIEILEGARLKQL